MKRVVASLSWLAAGLLSAHAHAHQIWLEGGNNNAPLMIRFGEFGENLRETSPGLLDRFGKPTASLLVGASSTPADARKSNDGFLLPFKVAKGQSVIAEDAEYPLRRFRQNDKDVTSVYHPAARYVADFSKQAPKLTLDVVPTGKPGEFALYFKGQPLPKTKINLVVQSGWTKEGRTDEQGQVKFDMPWKGPYVVEVSHTDRSGGERNGERYDVVTYVSTLTIVKPDGVAPLPAGPAATPNQ